ncbi:MAG: hypothetical protein J6Y19_11085 [Kiritimatiellae bacterium]|nr:hypothetical protein [Kiritimatiellia bacterium]
MTKDDWEEEARKPETSGSARTNKPGCAWWLLELCVVVDLMMSTIAVKVGIWKGQHHLIKGKTLDFESFVRRCQFWAEASHNFFFFMTTHLISNSTQSPSLVHARGIQFG